MILKYVFLTFFYSVKNNFFSSRAVLSNYHPAHLNIFKIIFEVYYQNRRPKCNVPNLLKFCLQKFRKGQRLCHLHQKAVANGRETDCKLSQFSPSPSALGFEPLQLLCREVQFISI